MEENLKSRVLVLSSALLSACAGITGAYANMASGGGILSLPDKLIVDGLLGGAILGFGVGFTIGKMKPDDDEEWKGPGAVTVLLGVSASVASGVGAGFYVACRLIRA
jgi:hypothetical protein